MLNNFFVVIINIINKNSCDRFCEKHDSLINRKFKIIYFYNNVNICTISFDKCNASLLNKSINFLWKCWLILNFWKVGYI